MQCRGSAVGRWRADARQRVVWGLLAAGVIACVAAPVALEQSDDDGGGQGELSGEELAPLIFAPIAAVGAMAAFWVFWLIFFAFTMLCLGPGHLGLYAPRLPGPQHPGGVVHPDPVDALDRRTGLLLRGLPPGHPAEGEDVSGV